MRRRDGERGGARPERGDGPRGVRCFVAVLLPEAVRQRIDEAATALRAREVPVSWVRAENLHVTLRFLGAVDEATLGRARESLAEAAAEVAPFRLAVGGFGGFPSADTPRVLWVGIAEGGEALIALHARLERALAGRGIPHDARAFHPHVTLGRARAPRGATGLGDLLTGAGAALGETRVEAVHLMRSDLHPAGSRYGVLAQETLAGPPGPLAKR